MRRPSPSEGERGTTIIELLVGLAAGSVILFAVSSMIIVSLHETARVTTRVNTTQRARVALSTIIEELHSACIAPQIAPVQTGSTGTSLIFIHQAGSGAVLTPVLSKVNLDSGTLSQTDYEATGGTVPKWTFASTPLEESRPLMTDIAPTAPSSSIFSYYGYANGKVSTTPFPTPLSEENASHVIQVSVAFTADPTSTPVADQGAPASIQDSALLRLTPASYNTEVVSSPCQ